MIKLFVSDLDGTLLNESKAVEQHNIDALKQLREQSIDICLASGRMDNEILKIANDVEDSFHRISQNGAYVMTNENHSLHEKVFEHEVASKLYSLTRLPDKLTIVCSNHTNFVEEKTEIVEQIEKLMFFPIEVEAAMQTEIGVSLAPSKITVLGEDAGLLTLQRELAEAFPNEIDTYISAPKCLDIMPKSISKGNAIQLLIEHLQIKPKEVACIGDSFNDIPMFKLTPNSFAMSTAPEAVKKEAAHVVDSVSEAIQIVLKQNEPSHVS
ncbi:Cof-type HAD-IIB family hydrolase [Metabacillus iocasae]|uniref:Cof subfamily protein (Haloacid dehalogenase superfamily) n=1 Tax=Priestia iocasae TaxID=2291674 RepID=A0ABS2QYZ1_9BACI|nr:Cof-type HAD-IIB family hydrolase [Metabacillus iocasae]MBM7704713.1 Cof subfamily protein (haloacid dehalogenase superfamily) [Metabacillus iocasae]